MADQVLKPGMSATCEFIQIEIKDVLLVPQQAVQREGGKTYVRVKSSDPMKPERREVKLGELGNDGYQVLEGLKEGEEVVIAEINLQQLRERQARIEQQQQGGGFTAGAGGQGPQRR
jgi:multidrug efflux pump subunit AcrA (membrane-fusion protein)